MAQMIFYSHRLLLSLQVLGTLMQKYPHAQSTRIQHAREGTGLTYDENTFLAQLFFGYVISYYCPYLPTSHHFSSCH